MATFHRVFIEQLLEGRRRHGIEIVGLLPFNLDPGSTRRPPVENILVPPDGASSAAYYADILRATRPDVVVFQHICHRWAVHHAEVARHIPALGVIHSWHAVTFRPPAAAERARRTLETALAACSQVVLPSDYSRVEGERLGFRYPDRVSVIGCPLGAAFIDESGAALPGQERAGWVFVGSLVERKSPLAAVEAAARCRQPLTLIGDGPLEEDVRLMAKRLGAGDLVHLAGRLPPELVRDALRRAELFCLPSQSESFGIAYAEALSCGTPIVGPVVCVEEFNRRLDTRCGVAVATSAADDIERAATRVSEATWDRPDLRRRALEAFSPAAATAEYVALLRRLVW